MPSLFTSLKRPAFAAAATAALLCLSPAFVQAAAQIEQSTPPSDLQASIGFMTLVQLPCAYSPAGANAEGGEMTLYNPTGKNIDRGRPVIYRLSATGEHFTVHLKSDAAPRQSTKVAHRHAEVSRCEAWTYIR
ncbi:MAG: hypothetical protein GY948_23245 [Alphaproteobacteria bacterium]|nr:hypothetical protein [Alphaproteobacteria bacterium]